MTVTFRSMECGKKFFHFSNGFGFVGVVHVVVRVWNPDDSGARYAAAKGVGPGITARCVVRYKRSFAIRVVGRKAVPVVRAGIDGKHGNTNVRVLLGTKVE